MIYFKINSKEYSNNDNLELVKVAKTSKIKLNRLKKGKYYITIELTTPDNLIISLMRNNETLISKSGNGEILFSYMLNNIDNACVCVRTTKGLILNGGISLTRLD